MLTIHDGQARKQILESADKLRDHLLPAWGSLGCAAMLYHLNAAMLMALGELAAEPVGNPGFWHTKGKAIALSDEPWPEGAPTSKEALPSGAVRFEEELERFRALIQRLANKELAGPWPVSARFGPMSGEEWSRLTYTHIRHHFTQFGVWMDDRSVHGTDLDTSV